MTIANQLCRITSVYGAYYTDSKSYRTNGFTSSVPSNFTFPSRPTSATRKPVGTSGICFFESASSSFGLFTNVTADCTDPAGESAISLISLDVKTSLMRDALEDINIVVGPWNCSNSRSPHIVRLAAVLRLNSKFVIPLHVSVCLITLKNLISGTKRLSPRLGTWNFRLENFNRYGSGGCWGIVYATTLPGCATYASPALNVIW